MSVEAITWALRQPVRPSSAKFVLVVLGNCANAETGAAYPSIAYLATATGQDRKTVQASLQRLAEWGLIEDTGRRVGATRKVVVWRVLCGPDLFNPATGDREKRDHPENGTIPKTAANGPEIPGKRSQKRDAETKGTVREPKAAAMPPLPEWLDAKGRKAWADFVDHRQAMRNPRAPLSERAAELVLMELDKLRAQGHDPAAVLDQSTRNGWRDVFPLKAAQVHGVVARPTPSEASFGRQPAAAAVLAASRPRTLADPKTAAAALAEAGALLGRKQPE